MIQKTVGGGLRRVKITACPKPVRIMLETWNSVDKYAHVYSSRKYTF